MTTAKKLVTIAEKVIAVFEAGKAQGGGGGSFYDNFWDSYQNGGKRTDYLYAFAGAGWNNSTYNPKHSPLDMSGNGQMAFTYSLITDTKVPIDITKASANISGMFNNAKKLVTINKIMVSESTASMNSFFTNCSALENITIEGVIGKNINVQWCTKLTHDSLMSIINALQNKTNDTSGSTFTLTIGSENYAKLTESEIEIARSKGWEVV